MTADLDAMTVAEAKEKARWYADGLCVMKPDTYEVFTDDKYGQGRKLSTAIRTLLAHVAEVEQQRETAQSYQRAAVKHLHEARDESLMNYERAEKAEAERDTLRATVARVEGVIGDYTFYNEDAVAGYVVAKELRGAVDGAP